jgi:hypothetical protein
MVEVSFVQSDGGELVFSIQITRKCIYLLVIGALSSLDIACSRPKRQLDAASAAQCNRVVAQSLIEQDEVILEARQGYSSTGVGLTAGINTIMSNRARKKVKPLNDAVSDLNFRDLFWEKLTPALEQGAWPEIERVDRLKGRVEVTDESTSQSGVLEIATGYSLSIDARVLKIVTNFRVVPRGETKATGIGTIRYEAPWLPDGLEKEAAIAKWAENGGALFRQGIQTGIDQMAKMIPTALLYLGNKYPLDGKRQAEMRSPQKGLMFHGLTNREQKVWILEEDGEMLQLLTERGLFLSLPKSTVEEVKD